MIRHYSPLLTSIKTMFGYKTNSFVGASFYSAIGIETFSFLWDGTYLGVSTALLSITSFLILVDWGFGSAASIKLRDKALEEGDKEGFENNKFSSIKVSHTIFKFISLWLWLLLAYTTNEHTKGIAILEPIIQGLSIVPILLFAFREYISIGEAMEILNNKKPYIFILGEKIFEGLQFKFLNKLK